MEADTDRKMMDPDDASWDLFLDAYTRLAKQRDELLVFIKEIILPEVDNRAEDAGWYEHLKEIEENGTSISDSEPRDEAQPGG